MFGAFACPDTRGFAKVAALEIETQIQKTAKKIIESINWKGNTN